jgi:hypothetical protein
LSKASKEVGFLYKVRSIKPTFDWVSQKPYTLVPEVNWAVVLVTEPAAIGL